MSHRIQITLTDDQFERITQESARSGLGIGELVRRALDKSYGRTGNKELIEALNSSFGFWKDRDFTAEEYVDRLRPGMGKRLAMTDDLLGPDNRRLEDPRRNNE